MARPLLPAALLVLLGAPLALADLESPTLPAAPLLARTTDGPPSLRSMVNSKTAPAQMTFVFENVSEGEASWDFGDGASGAGLSVRHTYYRPGRYPLAVALAWRGRNYSYRTSIEVGSAGPETARAVVLLGNGTAAFSAAGSVVYQPYTPTFLLNGRAVADGRQSLPAGSNTLTVTINAASGPVSKTMRFLGGAVRGNLTYEQEVLRLTNAARAGGWDCRSLRPGGAALPPLKVQRQLSEAAEAQSVGMALAGYFSHVSGVDGSTLVQRVEATGYRYRQAGENIAAGQPTPQSVVDGWLRSPGHCADIMGDFAEIGVAYALSSQGRPYWTQVFGQQQGS